MHRELISLGHHLGGVAKHHCIMLQISHRSNICTGQAQLAAAETGRQNQPVPLILSPGLISAKMAWRHSFAPVGGTCSCPSGQPLAWLQLPAKQCNTTGVNGLQPSTPPVGQFPSVTTFQCCPLVTPQQVRPQQAYNHSCLPDVGVTAARCV